MRSSSLVVGLCLGIVDASSVVFSRCAIWFVERDGFDVFLPSSVLYFVIGCTCWESAFCATVGSATFCWVLPSLLLPVFSVTARFTAA